MVTDAIAKFVRRYVREQDYYERVAQLVGQALQRELRDRNVRNITTWRAKRADRLEKKLREREQARVSEGRTRYASESELYDDIPDLAGARVALYFPSDRDVVREIIEGTFEQLRPVKRFPSAPSQLDATARPPRAFKRFAGYTAEHYRVRLGPELEKGDYARFREGRCEIQVASVLMHAWAEVEHDLEYKVLSGPVSQIESVLLDQINGLVIAGEIALEQLQRATVERSAGRSPGAVLRDHYDLANWLANVEPPSSSGAREVGRADLAFRFLEKLDLTAVAQLTRYQNDLRSRLEADTDEIYRLADHLVELLREEDPARDAALAEARKEVTASEQATAPAATPEAPVEAVVLGTFLQKWRTLEHIVTRLRSHTDGSSRGPVSVGRTLREFLRFDTVRAEDLRELQHLRSRAVHGTTDAPTSAQLLEGAQKLEQLIRRMPADAISEEARSQLDRAIKDALPDVPHPAPAAPVGTALHLQAGPAVVLSSRSAVIVPLVVTNPAPSETTLSDIRLRVGEVTYAPSLPVDGIVVTGFPFRAVDDGLRLQAHDAVRCALYFGPSLESDAVAIPSELHRLSLEIESVRDGTLSSDVEIHRNDE